MGSLIGGAAGTESQLTVTSRGSPNTNGASGSSTGKVTCGVRSILLLVTCAKFVTSVEAAKSLIVASNVIITESPGKIILA